MVFGCECWVSLRGERGGGGVEDCVPDGKHLGQPQRQFEFRALFHLRGRRLSTYAMHRAPTRKAEVDIHHRPHSPPCIPAQEQSGRTCTALSASS